MNNLPDGFILEEELSATVKARPSPDGGFSLGLPEGFVLEEQADPSAGRATRAQRGEDQITQSQAFTSGLAQGASIGAGDELSAAAIAGPGVLGDNERRKREITERASAELGFSLPTVPSPLAAIAGGARMLAEKVAPSWFGSEGSKTYEADLAKTRQDIRAAEQQYPMTTLAGNVAGGLALPVVPVSGVKSGAIAGAGMAGAYGFNSGEGVGDRLAQAATGLAIGGATGALAGKLAGPAAPAQPNAVVQAADDLGVNVPRAIASDSMIVQRVGQGVRNVPLAGERIVGAVANVNDDLSRVANKLADDLGSGNAALAGQAASLQIEDWVTGTSKKAVTSAYEQVEKLINPSVTTPLRSTAAEATKILQERAGSRVNDPGKAVSFVSDAIQDQTGLTYEGIKNLRTRVREMIKNPSMMPAETSKAELERIYRGLTADLKDAVENSGGKAALQAFNRANSLNAAVAERRKELAKIVGQNAEAPAEKVFEALLARASTSSRADIQLLAKARQAIGNDWDEVGSAVISRLGRDAEGTLTPDRFLTAYGKISEQGKNILFDPTTRKALDDIATISGRMKEVGSRFGNPSGTGQAVIGVGAAGAAFSEPVTTLSVLAGSNIAARILAAPATAKSTAQWARAYELAVRQPSAKATQALAVASRELSDKAAEVLGVNLAADQLMKAISGPLRTVADPSNGQAQPEEQNR